MKRFWFGAALLAVLLITAGWLGNRMVKNTLPCADELEQAAASAMAEDWHSAKTMTSRARARWEENRRISASLSDHEELDEIDALFEELEIYGAREETVGFAAGCAFLAEKFRDLGQSNRLSWWNLL